MTPDNIKPISDAGADQEVYAFIDGYALVQLDGTGSTDADEDALEYYWYSDANDLVATEAEPNVLLPVGEHVINLVVYDGIEDSEPDSCVVTVVEALEGRVAMLPQVLNLKSHGDHVTATVILPDGMSIDGLDENEPWRLLPGDIEALSTRTTSNRKWQKVDVVFDRQAINDVLWPGQVEVTVYSKLESGRTVGGKVRIRVISPGRDGDPTRGNGKPPIAETAGVTSPTWEGYPAVEIDQSVHPTAIWLLTHGLPHDTDLHQDHNGDGVDLLMAYALHLDPNNALAGMPKAFRSPGGVSMTFYAATPGVTYTVQTSTDMESWTTDGVTLSAPDPDGMRTATIDTTAPRRFMRLVVVCVATKKKWDSYSGAGLHAS